MGDVLNDLGGEHRADAHGDHEMDVGRARKLARHHVHPERDHGQEGQGETYRVQ